MKDLVGEVSWEAKEFGHEFAEGDSAAWVDELGLPIAYQAWSDENTRVVSGPYGPVGYSDFRGTRFRDRRSARLHWCLRATVVEEYRVPGRWIFRIKKG